MYGTSGLRVIDASIFPTIPTGNTNAAVMMVAEKGADMIKNTWHEIERSKNEQRLVKRSTPSIRLSDHLKKASELTDHKTSTVIYNLREKVYGNFMNYISKRNASTEENKERNEGLEAPAVKDPPKKEEESKFWSWFRFSPKDKEESTNTETSEETLKHDL